MIAVKTMIFAENLIRDVDSDKISAINILDGGFFKEFPVFIPTLCVLSISVIERGDPSEYDLRMVIRMGKDKIFDAPFHIDFKDRFRNRHQLKIYGFVIPTPGLLQAQVYLGRRKLGACGVEISLMSQSPRIESSDA